MAFRFSGGAAPPQQVLTDVQALNALSKSQLDELTDIILSFLSNEGDIVESLGQFSQTHGVGEKALKATTQGALYFFKGAIRANLSPQLVKDDLLLFGLNEENASLIALKWKTKFAQISRSTITTTLQVNPLVDMQWRFGVTAATSELGKAGTTYLQLKLVFDKGNGTTEEKYMELDLPTFYQFSHEMQKAKANLEYFSY